MPKGTRTKPPFNWLPESERTLRKLWASGLTASQIARQFGGRVTRCAVIGKAWRMKLPRRKIPHYEQVAKGMVDYWASRSA